MPSLEIICIAQIEPSDFSNLPFTVKSEKKLISHRSPNPLFQSDFDRLHGFIYHVSDGQSPTCYGLLVRNWYGEQGNASDVDENVEFREEYAGAMNQMLEELLRYS